MKDEDSLFKPNRVNSAVGTAFIVLNHFQDTGSTEALQYPGRMVLAVVLGQNARHNRTTCAHLLE
ncbi:hypothetical protein, partial [Rhizobium sp. rho-13.1]|uniref:hypothetical protein n=1 Tax=Rhizobium sp. rho-13.1 TaxID=2506431 RepID=UPI001FCEE3A3